MICRIHQLSSILRYESTLSGTLSLLFSPSGTKALIRQFIYTISVGMAYNLPGTLALYWCACEGYMSCLLLCVFIAPFRFGTIWNDIFSTKLAELWGLTVSISLDDSTTAGGAWHFCVGRLLLLRSKSGPGGTLYQYGLCELAQRQAVLVR